MSVERIGPYEIEGILGRGAMSTVFRARHTISGEPAALKSLNRRLAQAQPALRREVQALSRLAHPGIVRVQANGMTDSPPWYAMELVEGTSLQEHSRGRTWTELLDVWHRLCCALAYLHGEGAVHRDLCSRNVMVRPDGRPVLVDFGFSVPFAGPVSRETLESGPATAGSLESMAPEQLRGELVDARADLYALGVLLFASAAGRPPFVGEAHDVIRGHLEAEPPRLRSVCPEAPEALEQIVSKLLAKRPEARPGTARSVAALLAGLGARPDPVYLVPPPRAYLYRPKLAGREAIWSELLGALDALGRGTGQILFLGGESGVGKTRLALELSQEARRRGLWVVTGECPPGPASEGAPIALGAFRGLLRAVAERCHEQGPSLTRRWLGTAPQLLAAYEPALSGLAAAGPPLEPLPPEQARQRMLRAVASVLGCVGQDEPMLLVLDDLHWADELSLGLLRALLESPRSRQTAVCVLCTYRSEEAGSALRGLLRTPGAANLVLDRLDEPAIRQITADMMSLWPPPVLLGNFLMRHSDGNPFFVAEYLRAAVAEGLLYHDETGRWQVGAKNEIRATESIYEEMGLPASLRDLVGRRLDGVSARARALCGAASAWGRSLEEEALEALMPGAGGESALEELVQGRILEEERHESGPARLRFVHEQLRAAAYEALSAPQRRTLHRRAAGFLESRAGSERLAELGLHRERAGNKGKARVAYLAAARLEAGRYSFREAERLYQAYLRLVRKPTRESRRARLELAKDSLAPQGKKEEAAGHCLQVVEEARAGRDHEVETQALLGLLHLYRDLGHGLEIAPLYERALAGFQKRRDVGGEVSVLVAWGFLLRERGRALEARTLFERAIGLARGAADLQAEADATRALAMVENQLGDFEAAHEAGHRALDLFRQARLRRKEARTLHLLGAIEANRGRLPEAMEHLEQCLVHFREENNTRSQSSVMRLLGSICEELGRYEDAEHCFEQALSVSTGVDTPRDQVLLMQSYASFLKGRGRLEEARPVFEAALRLVKALGDTEREADLRAELAGPAGGVPASFA